MTDDAPLPIHHPEAEDAVISAAILSPKALTAAREVVAPEHFYSDVHRRVFDAVCSVDDEGRAVDAVTVATVLRASGRLNQIGGTPELARLIDSTPAVLNVSEHARLVKDSYVARETVAALETAAVAIRSGVAWRVALDEMRETLRKVRMSPEARTGKTGDEQ